MVWFVRTFPLGSVLSAVRNPGLHGNDGALSSPQALHMARWDAAQLLKGPVSRIQFRSTSSPASAASLSNSRCFALVFLSVTAKIIAKSIFNMLKIIK